MRHFGMSVILVAPLHREYTGPHVINFHMVKFAWKKFEQLTIHNEATPRGKSKIETQAEHP